MNVYGAEKTTTGNATKLRNATSGNKTGANKGLRFDK